MKVTVRNGNVDAALRIFKRKVKNSGLLEELKAREFFEKPSVKKSKAKKYAISRERARTVV